MAAKKCSKCGVEKPLDQFHKQKWCKFGVRPDCKACFYAASKKRIARDPEAERAYKRAYRELHRAEIAARDRAYYEANKERRIAQSIEYARKNRDAYLARMRKWRKENPEKVQVWVRNRRAKLRWSGGEHTVEDIKALISGQRGRCVYCRADIKKAFQVDHIVPVSRGGSNDRSNLQLLCKPCNLKKRDKDPAAFAQERGLLL